MFLPANTTSVIQPMDQGILEPLKKRYKKRLLQHLIIENESSSLTIPEVLKQITIKDVVYWSAQAWDEASSSSLASGWKKLLQCETVSQLSVSDSVTAEVVASDEHRDVSADVSEFEELFDSLGYAENDSDWSLPRTWLMEDATDPGYQIMNEEEIVADLMHDREELESEDEEEAHSSAVTPSQACAAFDTALEWLESKGSTDPAHLMLVKGWRDDAAKQRWRSMKQTKITSYFK